MARPDVMNDPLQAQGELIYEALRRMARQLLARKAGGHLVGAKLEELDLRLNVPLKGLRAESGVFSREIVAAVEAQIDEVIERAAAFRPGHTYCHHCAGSICEHSLPPDARHVFVGYSPVGAPLWIPFPQYCLEMKHPDVQGLYRDPPVFLTISQDAETLRGDLLDAWRNPAYELLAQLVAGYFRVAARDGAGRGVLALTFQVTGSQASNGRLHLGLNVLGHAPAGDLERAGDFTWRRSIAWAQSALESVTRPRRGGGRQKRAEIEERVAGILGGLARRLEREQRGRSRRTAHAQRRHASGERPTRKAMDDVFNVRPDAILVDEHSGVLVILGGRGRTHFLTPEGRLVSSVRYSRDAIERKQKLGTWRAASPGEARELLGVLKGQGTGGASQGS